MKLIKKFEEFVYGGASAPAPSTSPNPVTAPPKTKPTRPSKPTPIRTDKPAVEPGPLAKLKTATEEEVIHKFADLTKQNY